MNEEIKIGALEVVCDVLGCDKDEVQLDSDFRNDLGADSLDAIEIVSKCETRFQISITDEEIEKIFYFRNLLKTIEDKLNEKE